MPSTASKLVFALRGTAATQRRAPRIDRLASRFGNIAIGAALLLAPLTASLGVFLPARNAEKPAPAAKAPAPAPAASPLRQRPL